VSAWTFAYGIQRKIARMMIRLLEFAVGKYASIKNPIWDHIESAIRTLALRPGRIYLWEDRDNGLAISISGSSGVFALDVLVVDSQHAMLVSKSKVDESTVEVRGDEFRADQVVYDLELVIRLVKELIESNQFPETDDVKWVFVPI
jgi:hypothetical protein